MLGAHGDESGHAWRRNTWGSNALCVVMYGTRSTLAPLLLLVAHEERLPPAGSARLLSAFHFGYVWLQIPAGFVCQRAGCRSVLLASIVASALAMLGAAAAPSVACLQLCLALLGVCHAPTMPGRIDLAARVVPAAHRARHLANESIAAMCGPLVFAAVAPKLAAAIGWRATLVVQAATVLLLALFFAKMVDPVACGPVAEGTPPPAAMQRHPLATAATAATAVAPPPPPQRFPWWLLARRSCWAIVAAHTAGNFGGQMLSSWTPTIFDSALALPPAAAATWLVAPPIAGLAGRTAAAWAVPALQRRLRIADLSVRRWSCCVMNLLQCVAALAFASAGSPLVATAGLWCVLPVAAQARLARRLPPAAATRFLFVAFLRADRRTPSAFACAQPELRRNRAGQLLRVRQLSRGGRAEE